MKIWKHVLIVFIFGCAIILVSLVNMMFCGLTFGPRESDINCKIMQLFGYFPFPLELIKHHASNEVTFLLFLINHIFVVSIVYVVILFLIHKLKKDIET